MKLDPTKVSLGGALWVEVRGLSWDRSPLARAAPDLRASPLHHSRDAVLQVLREGALADSGMPKFSELTDDQVDALRQYIEFRARKDIGKDQKGS